MTCPSCGSANDDQAAVCFTCKAPLSELARGDVLDGRYEIREFLGRGGMGTVYRVHDRTLNEDVALKVVRPELMSTKEASGRFVAEIKLARRVSHPGVCRIYEVGEDGSRRYFTMELVAGRNLRALLRAEGPLSPERACAMAAEIADGLQAIHAASIVHRDLKSLNVMVDPEDRIRLMDFSIAKGLVPDGQGTATGYVVGSPEYMSPEQARGRAVDARSDVYALGIVLFEMLTGDVPFRAPDPVSTLLMQVEETPPLDRFPEALRGVLERALAKDPDQRFRTAAQMAMALRRTLPAGAAEASTRPLPAVRPNRRWWVAVALAVGVALASWRARPRAESESVAPPSPSVESAPPPVASPPLAVPSASPTPGRAAPAVPTTTLAPTPVAQSLPTLEPSPTAPPEAPPTTSAPAPTPEPAAPPPPISTRPATGQLNIAVTPWVNVSIDGVHVGETPLTQRLPPGEHKVVLTHRDYLPVHRVVRIVAGETERLSVDMSRDAVKRRR